MRATVRRRIGRAGLVAVACALVAGCALRAPAPRGGPPGEVGLASWYGPELDGSRTASGEVFRPSEMTAAHPSLPIGTRVRVTNLENGRSVSCGSTTGVRSSTGASSTCRGVPRRRSG